MKDMDELADRWRNGE